MRILILTIFGSALLSGSQVSVSGMVFDSSARPIPGAVVECNGRQGSTDQNGRFSFPDISTCDAVITHPGFERTRAALEAGREARITLALAPRNESMIVSATRAPIALEEAGVSATVTSDVDFAARDYMPIPDILREVPGLTVMNTSRRGGLTSVYTRGAQRTATLVLLDGVPLNEPGGEMNLAHLSSAGIARMEVVRGPESALFGAEAGAGVVQLFTERGDPETARPHGSASYERGSFQTDRWTGNVNGGALNRLDYSLTAEQFHTVGEYQNDYYRDTTGTANLGYRFTPATQARAIFRTYDAIAGNPDQVGWGVYNLDANSEDRSSTLALNLDDARGNHYFQRLSFRYNRYRDRYNDAVSEGPYNVAALVRDVAEPHPAVYLDRLVPYTFPSSDVPPGERLVTNSVTLGAFPGLTVSERKGLDYQGTLTHKGGALVFGYEFERQSGLISGTDVTRDNNGVFLHEQYTVARRLFLTGGIRAEHSSTFGRRFAPRGSATALLLGEHGPLSATYFRVSAGRGITEPSLIQNFADESFYVGNPHLKPEKIDTYEAALTQELFHRRVRAEVAAFRSSFTDLIVFDFSKYPSTWSNIDRSRAQGIETSVTAKPASFASITGTWTHMDTRVVSTASTDPYSGVGQELPRRPGNFGSLVLQLTPHRWTVVAGGRFAGERQDADFVFNITRNPAYSNAFLSASYQLNRHLMPYIRIDNLTNERYAEVLGYPALSRNAIGGMRLSW